MNNLFLDLEKEKHTKIKKKKEYENLTFKLSNDLLEMSQQREKEKLEFENWKIEEIRKLQKDFKTENDKIRAVFFYTTSNLSYDVANMFTRIRARLLARFYKDFTRIRLRSKLGL